MARLSSAISDMPGAVTFGPADAPWSEIAGLPKRRREGKTSEWTAVKKKRNRQYASCKWYGVSVVV